MAGGTKMYMMEEEKEVMPMMCGDLFDHIDDLLDFPNDNNDVDDLIRMEGGMVDPSFTFTNGGGVPFTPAAGILPLQNEPSLILPPLQADCDGGLIGGGEGGVMMANTGPGENTRATTSTLNGEDDKVFENLDIADLEWFSNFIYDEADSFSLVTLPVPADIDGGDVKQDSIFRTSSPVSVLEPNSISGGGGGDGGSSASSASSSFSSSSCSGNNSGGRAAVPISPPHPVSTAPARARSKRRRTTTFSPRSHVSISFLPTHSSLLPLPAPEPESFGESSTGINPTMMKSAKKKKKKKSNEEREGEEEAGPPAARRCTHCQIQKTPQWRAGPLGPKTLCNACGVRYKSGRLFPEYRPAASPTFVPSIHSNSHKKVVEMRLMTTTLPGAAPPKSCDLLDYIRRRE